MNYMAHTPPRTIMEVWQSLPEGTLAEVIDGKLIMSPAPNTLHQRVLAKLHLAIGNYVEKHRLGEVFFAPVDVYLDEHSNVVQPDILFISSARAAVIKQNGVYGAPDLIIEALSPGNRKHDLETKKALYEQFGVQEYWIIDPITKQCMGYALRDGIFEALPSSSAGFCSVLLGADFSF